MMISIDLMGGLGNQLFQIFFLWSYAKRHGRDFRLPDRTSFLNRHMYWDDFLRSLVPFLVPDWQVVSLPVIHEIAFPYHDYPSYPHPARFLGYFQSPRYFEHDLDEILRVIGWEERCREVPVCDAHDVSMHFRRGDYKNVPHAHPLVGNGYYREALETVFRRAARDRLRVLYFYESADKEEIDAMIGALTDDRYAFTDGTTLYDKDWHQLVAMTRCPHSIIANSTFSWWGAILASSRRVCYPSTWINDVVSDLFPEEWVMIDSHRSRHK
jgi:hypothetical protein